MPDQMLILLSDSHFCLSLISLLGAKDDREIVVAVVEEQKEKASCWELRELMVDDAIDAVLPCLFIPFKREMRERVCHWPFFWEREWVSENKRESTDAIILSEQERLIWDSMMHIKAMVSFCVTPECKIVMTIFVKISLLLVILVAFSGACLCRRDDLYSLTINSKQAPWTVW